MIRDNVFYLNILTFIRKSFTGFVINFEPIFYVISNTGLEKSSVLKSSKTVLQETFELSYTVIERNLLFLTNKFMKLKVFYFLT